MERAEHQPNRYAALKPFKPDPSVAEHARQFRQAPSPEEIARRQKAGAELVKVRDEIGPIDVDPTDLLRRAREEDDAIL